ncbi:MAG: sortase [bacterium]|nr:sortase [bacterium]
MNVAVAEQKPYFNHRRFNNVLTVVAVVIALYIILLPLLPQLAWWVKEQSPIKTWTSNQQEVAAEAEEPIKDNRLLIPSLSLNKEIHEGGAESLNKGVVRRGQTSTPDKGSNTVLVGHRFTYDGKGVFYHLDKVKKGDEITVHWNKKAYKYRVTEIVVVKADAIEIEAPTKDDLLTIYTCTPLWSAKDRLVIKALPEAQAE